MSVKAAAPQWAVTTQMQGAAPRTETYAEHEEARKHYERAIASRVYMQIHIAGPGYGVRTTKRRKRT